jgi:isoquinoline 1-oxidoreductase subunit alpha
LGSSDLRSWEATVAIYDLTINGRQRRIAADPDTPMLWVLRDLLGLTGTKYGCGVGVCGACTIHQDGVAVPACMIPISRATGKAYTTIEGLSPGGTDRCQAAWLAEDVAQCGYCQAGMIMTAAALLGHTPHPTDAAIDAALAGLVCRCGTYQRIRRAIHRAASEASP